MKPVRTWILIANGSRARIVTNNGPGKGLRQIHKIEDDHLKPGEIMADRPGRTFDSSGSGRHAMAYSSDPARVRQMRFVLRVLEFLDDELANSSFDRLIIAAPAKFLGDLRESISKPLQAATMSELSKDLTHLKIEKLPEHFADILAL